MPSRQCSRIVRWLPSLSRLSCCCARCWPCWPDPNGWPLATLTCSRQRCKTASLGEVAEGLGVDVDSTRGGLLHHEDIEVGKPLLLGSTTVTRDEIIAFAR